MFRMFDLFRIYIFLKGIRLHSLKLLVIQSEICKVFLKAFRASFMSFALELVCSVSLGVILQRPQGPSTNSSLQLTRTQTSPSSYTCSRNASAYSSLVVFLPSSHGGHPSSNCSYFFNTILSRGPLCRFWSFFSRQFPPPWYSDP